MADFEYWAATDGDEIGNRLAARVENYGTAQLTSGVLGRCAREFQYYFGYDPSGIHATSQILRKGEQGELAAIRVNHARPLVNTLLNLIVSPKIVWTPKAVNLDYDSIRACELAASVLEYYWTEKNVVAYAVRALEEALVFGEGFVMYEWDSDRGEPYAAVPPAPEDTPMASDGAPAPATPGQPEDPFASASVVTTGDIRFRNVSTWDVIRDSTKLCWDDLDWVIVRIPINRYRALAKWGEPGNTESEISRSILTADEAGQDKFKSQVAKEQSDDISVYHFYHKPCPQLPNGRQVVFLQNKLVLKDGPLKYEDWPLMRVSAGELIGTPFGYTPFLDILGIQELMDSLHTSVASNQSTFGTQLIAVPMGSDVPIDDLAGGMKAIYYPPDQKPPQGLNLTSTPREIFAYLDTLKKNQEMIFGLNSVVRGEPQSGEQSGSALAMLQSQALQQSSVIQGAYFRFVRAIGAAVVSTFRDYADVPMKIGIVGKANSSLVVDTEVTGQSFSRIKRVEVDIGNPLAQTPAGRVKMAEDLMARNMLESREQYMQVIGTGRIDPITSSMQREMALIVSENEALSRGEQPPVVDLDEHQLHAREHRAVLADPEARRRPEVVNAVLAHIQEHENAYYGTSPQTLALVGQTPPPEPQMPQPGQGPVGAAPGPSGNPAAKPPATPGATKLPMLPNQPVNPGTGRRFDPVTGGGVVSPPQ